MTGERTIVKDPEGYIFLTRAGGGREMVAATGAVELGRYIDSIDQLPIGAKRTERAKRIVMAGCSDVEHLLAKGGILTLRGTVASLGLEDLKINEYLSTQLAQHNMVISTGAHIEKQVEFNQQGIFLSPTEKLLLIVEGLSRNLGYSMTKAGSQCLFFRSHDLTYHEDIVTVKRGIENRFRNIFDQAGFGKIGIIGKKSLTNQLLMYISDHDGLGQMDYKT